MFHGWPLRSTVSLVVWLFVESHEVIPQTHRNGHETPATLGLMLGFALMMVLDTTSG